mmetsp:Transcript_14383/g.41171  ORF Transcript_14383/g.41171 Transcript_14383/m.41171 type:complete len:354 (+) Transcript_14383:1543-2604(+)
MVPEQPSCRCTRTSSLCLSAVPWTMIRSKQKAKTPLISGLPISTSVQVIWPSSTWEDGSSSTRPWTSKPTMSTRKPVICSASPWGRGTARAFVISCLPSSSVTDCLAAESPRRGFRPAWSVTELRKERMEMMPSGFVMGLTARYRTMLTSGLNSPSRLTTTSLEPRSDDMVWLAEANCTVGLPTPLAQASGTSWMLAPVTPATFAWRSSKVADTSKLTLLPPVRARVASTRRAARDFRGHRPLRTVFRICSSSVGESSSSGAEPFGRRASATLHISRVSRSWLPTMSMSWPTSWASMVDLLLLPGPNWQQVSAPTSAKYEMKTSTGRASRVTAASQMSIIPGVLIEMEKTSQM